MKTEALIIKRAEQRVRQLLFGGVALSVALIMILNNLGLLALGANQVEINVTVGIESGTFTISNGPTGISFTNQTYGVGNNVTGNVDIDNVAVTDYRGTSDAWSVAANANNLSDGTNTIYANKLTLYQDVRGTLTNVQNSTTSRVLLGSNGNIANAGVTLMNTSSSPGIIRFDNGFVNFLYTGTDPAGTYGAKIFLTLS